MSLIHAAPLCMIRKDSNGICARNLSTKIPISPITTVYGYSSALLSKQPNPRQLYIRRRCCSCIAYHLRTCMPDCMQVCMNGQVQYLCLILQCVRTAVQCKNATKHEVMYKPGCSSVSGQLQ